MVNSGVFTGRLAEMHRLLPVVWGGLISNSD